MTTRLENNIARAFVLSVAFAVMVGLGYLFADAFITEVKNRVEHLRIHRKTVIERSIQ